MLRGNDTRRHQRIVSYDRPLPVWPECPSFGIVGENVVDNECIVFGFCFGKNSIYYLIPNPQGFRIASRRISSGSLDAFLLSNVRLYIYVAQSRYCCACTCLYSMFVFEFKRPRINCNHTRVRVYVLELRLLALCVCVCTREKRLGIH